MYLELILLIWSQPSCNYDNNSHKYGMLFTMHLIHNSVPKGLVLRNRSQVKKRQFFLLIKPILNLISWAWCKDTSKFGKMLEELAWAQVPFTGNTALHWIISKTVNSIHMLDRQMMLLDHNALNLFIRANKYVGKVTPTCITTSYCY